MIASTHFGDYARRGIADEALARVPEIAFGDTDWVRRALQACAEYLKPAIASGKPYRIANAVRAVAHTPSVAQLDAVIGAVCDAMLAEAYATRNSRMIANLAEARAIIDEAAAVIRTREERTAADPANLREQVNGHMRLVAIHDAGLAARCEAIGELAARIGAGMKLPPAVVLDVELAGYVCDVGLIRTTLPRSKRGAVPKRDQFRHAILAETFVQTLPGLRHLAGIVRAHHERYDGSGLPDGLTGDEIPLESRIIAVAAAFTERVMPARSKPLLPDEACAEIAERSGTEFDPGIVTVALHVLQFRRRTTRSA
jgi:HD-GYP domain-containing protein (c-di-GMP phosphodiesterase class II)